MSAYTSPPSTRILLARAQAGESDAINALLERLRPRLVAWVTARLGPLLRAKLEAEDIVQEILIQANSAIPAFEPRGKRAFRAWLFTIAEHCIAAASDRFRAAKRDARRETSIQTRIPARQTSPSMAAARREEWDLLLDALRALPERYRTVLRLRRLEHRSNEEAAQTLGVTRKNASMLYVRAVRALRDVLAAPENPG